ncbi:hypothetical protein [Woeseia oceani]|uniref:Uncharacterized protein n=1 Tax=Woeseia oceani TaxID=1548547 RepID=A0A193LFM4_9GAMM|nr:hypothetical protein [Woeseia oceani]ANO51335.1 hypothetical protein BA177_09105 [Woeseia oceani]
MNFSFYTLRRTRSYWLSLSLFAAGNILSVVRYVREWQVNADVARFMGFPFPFYRGSLPADSGQLLWTGLLLDLVLAWTVAVSAAWLALLLAARRD